MGPPSEGINPVQSVPISKKYEVCLTGVGESSPHGNISKVWQLLKEMIITVSLLSPGFFTISTFAFPPHLVCGQTIRKSRSKVNKNFTVSPPFI